MEFERNVAVEEFRRVLGEHKLDGADVAMFRVCGLSIVLANAPEEAVEIVKNF